MVLVVSLIVMVVGVTSVAIARIQTRQSVRANDWAEAQALAFSAIEQAMSVLNSGEEWRKIYSHGTIAQTHSLGNGQYSWGLYDNVDGDLSDSDTDSITIRAMGKVGRASYSLRVDVTPTATTAAIDTGTWKQVVK